MKRIALFLFAILISLEGFTQDKLLLRNGDEMEVTVLEITPDSVLFSQLPVTIPPTIKAIPKSNVFWVAFQNGTKVIIPEPAQPGLPRLSEARLYALGRTEARRYYKAGGVFWATFATSAALPLGGPMLGIPVGALGTAIKVPEHRIVASNPEYIKSPGYVKGYRRQATNKKLGNAAAGVGAGTALALGIVIVLLTNSH